MKIIKNDKGFSLLEVLVTATIITIGLLAILGMQITSIKGNSFGYQMTAATTEAENIMEQIMRMPLSNSCFNDTDGDLKIPGSPFALDSTKCPCMGDLTPCINFSVFNNPNINGITLSQPRYIVEDQYPQSGSKTITIILDWIDNNGITRTIQMKTIKSM